MMPVIREEALAMTTKLYIATCRRCGSSAAGLEQPDRCPYCPPPADHAQARRRLGWLLAWAMILAGLAGLLR